MIKTRRADCGQRYGSGHAEFKRSQLANHQIILIIGGDGQYRVGSHCFLAFNLHKFLKYFRLIRLGDSRSVVLDGQMNIGTDSMRLKLNAAIAAHISKRVGNQICQHPGDFVRVRPNSGQVICTN